MEAESVMAQTHSNPQAHILSQKKTLKKGILVILDDLQPKIFHLYVVATI